MGLGDNPSMRIYFAGPLFSNAERDWNVRLAVALTEAGHEVFLPQVQEQGKPAAAVFQTDVDAIDRADVVLAIMDGPDPDSGTAWECGYAYGKKPIVLVRSDFRVWPDDEMPYNPMLTQSATIRLELGYADMPTIQREVLAALDRARG